MKAIGWFGAATVAIVLVVGLVFAIPFSSSDDHRAIAASAAVAVVVQLFAFTIARSASNQNYLTGWLIGLALRFVTLLVYGLVAVKGFGMPASAALISLVTFFFLSTLLEPKLLTL